MIGEEVVIQDVFPICRRYGCRKGYHCCILGIGRMTVIAGNARNARCLQRLIQLDQNLGYSKKSSDDAAVTQPVIFDEIGVSMPESICEGD